MADIHTGSWGLPDFGITEAIGGLLGTGLTSQGGSNLTSSVGTYPTAQVASPTGYQPLQGPGLGWSGDVYNPTNVLGTTTSTAGGGGGGMSGGTTTTTSGGGGTTTTPTTPTGPSSEDQLRADIESIFSPVMSYLGQAESTLGQNQQTALSGIGEQYQQSANTMASEKGTSMTALQGQEKQAGTRKEDALTSATRLYNELSRGGQQRFGGASSAGEAFQSLTAVEQQRRQGEIQSAYEGAMQKVGEYKANLEEKYNLAVKDLEVQKNQAINDVNTEFRNNMLSISQMKAEAESNKAQLRLQALQDLRNQVYAINLQNLQFAQQLALNKDISLKTVDQYSQQALSAITGGQNTVNNTLAGYNPLTSYGNAGTTAQTSTTAPVGAVTAIKKWDPMTGTYV